MLLKCPAHKRSIYGNRRVLASLIGPPALDYPRVSVLLNQLQLTFVL